MANILINWNNNYSVGHKVIDEQHQKLVDMINDLYSSFIEGNANEKAPEIVKEMVKYTDFHFKTEEFFFDKYSYPEVEFHKKEHISFVNKAVEVQKGLESGEITVSYDLMNFLRQWLINHILKEDKKFGSFFF